MLHTNRELGLMLRGAKPLAYFYEFSALWPEVLIRYFRLFDRHVAQGRMSKRVVPVETDRSVEFGAFQRLFYVLPGEEWRIDAMVDLVDRPGPWTIEREREQGVLLGYTESQCDWWLKHRCEWWLTPSQESD